MKLCSLVQKLLNQEMLLTKDSLSINPVSYGQANQNGRAKKLSNNTNIVLMP